MSRKITVVLALLVSVIFSFSMVTGAGEQLNLQRAVRRSDSSIAKGPSIAQNGDILASSRSFDPSDTMPASCKSHRSYYKCVQYNYGRCLKLFGQFWKICFKSYTRLCYIRFCLL